MGGKVTNYLNPVKAVSSATKSLVNEGKILASGKGKLSNFATAADDMGSLGLGNSMGLTKSLFGGGKGGAPTQAGATENPAQTLAQTGGAPLLANVAMGVDPKMAIAGYFGQSDFDSWYNGTPEEYEDGSSDGHTKKIKKEAVEGLGEDDRKLVDGVLNQLTAIQKNTNLRNQAVQQVMNDFPNIAAQAAKAMKDSGQQFDDVTKSYMDQALNSTAAKYAAGGSISSGAMNEATAKVGGQMGLSKLDYMSNRGDTAYNQGLQGWQARYNETNALRNFQNLMTGQAAGNGFSAVQASLGRTQQTNMANAGFANQQNMMEQGNNNAMLGAIGGVAGTVVGGYFGGPMGAAAGGKVGSSLASNASSSDSGSQSNWK